MTETLLGILITGAVTLAVCLINNHFQNKSAEAKQGETIALIEYKLSELTKHVEKHNGIIERTYKLEEHEHILDEKIKVINHRLHNLEEG